MKVVLSTFRVLPTTYKYYNLSSYLLLFHGSPFLLLFLLYKVEVKETLTHVARDSTKLPDDHSAVSLSFDWVDLKPAKSDVCMFFFLHRGVTENSVKCGILMVHWEALSENVAAAESLTEDALHLYDQLHKANKEDRMIAELRKNAELARLHKHEDMEEREQFLEAAVAQRSMTVNTKGYKIHSKVSDSIAVCSMYARRRAKAVREGGPTL